MVISEDRTQDNRQETRYGKPVWEPAHNEELRKIYCSQGRVELCRAGKPTALDVGNKLLNRSGEYGDSVGRREAPGRQVDEGCQATKTGTGSCVHTLRSILWPFRTMPRRQPAAKAGAVGDEGDMTSYLDPGLDHCKLRGNILLGAAVQLVLEEEFSMRGARVV